MIKENIQNIILNVKNICEKNDINYEDIKILAVTKTHPVEKMREAIQAGLDCIAENKIQDSCEKIPKLRGEFAEFHFIGHLQSNKIKKLMPLKPHLIHSLDKISTISKLNDYCVKNKIIQNILIQINTSNEESKNGINPSEAKDFIIEASKFSHIKILGLMTIGAHTKDEKLIRKSFRDLKNIFEDIKQSNITNVEMKYLSMGMSGDYEIALEEGANILRLGSIIFGNRIYS